jgi:hypothetical protein
MRICNEGFERLQQAIVLRVIYEYKRYLRLRNDAKAVELERWFLSEYGEWLSGGKGAFIVEQCKKAVNAETKNK